MIGFLRRHPALIGSVLIFCLSLEDAYADNLNFTPTCDEVWQTCCDCQGSLLCINWNRDPRAGLCPDFPSRLDDVTVSLDCTVGDSGFASAGTLVQSSGTFTIDGHLVIDTTATFNGPIVWTGGGIARAQSVGAEVTANDVVTISGSDEKYLGAYVGGLLGGITLINNANINWSGSGALNIGQIPGDTAPATLYNPVGRTFNVLTDADISPNASGAGLIVNEGTIIKSSATGVSDWTVNLSNSGLVHVKSGELRLSSLGNGDGEFRVDSGAKLSFSTPFYFEFKPGITFSGGGDAVLEDTGSGFGVVINDSVMVNRFRIAESGRLGGSGDWTITDELTVAEARVEIPTTIQSGARLLVEGNDQTVFYELNIEGVAEVAGKASLASSDHVMTIASGATVDLEDNATLASLGLVSQPIENGGTVRKASGTGTATVYNPFSATFDNNEGGLVEVSSGMLDFDMLVSGAGGQWQIDSGAALRARRSMTLTGGSITGGGSLIANVDNQGATIEPGASPGILAIGADDETAVAGNYTQGADGTLVIEIGGLTAGEDHDQLTVAGAAKLDGALQVSLIDGFIPNDGDSVTFLAAGSVGGQFAKMEGMNFPDGITATLVYEAEKASLVFSGMATGGGSSGGGGNGDSGDGGSGDGGSGDGGQMTSPPRSGGLCGSGGMITLPLLLVGWGLLLIRRR